MRSICNGLREEWVMEDEKLYAGRAELDLLAEKLEEATERIADLKSGLSDT